MTLKLATPSVNKLTSKKLASRPRATNPPPAALLPKNGIRFSTLFLLQQAQREDTLATNAHELIKMINLIINPQKLIYAYSICFLIIITPLSSNY